MAIHEGQQPLKMSLCQFLALFGRDNLVLLLGKHGLQTDELTNKPLRRNTVSVPQAIFLAHQFNSFPLHKKAQSDDWYLDVENMPH